MPGRAYNWNAYVSFVIDEIIDQFMLPVCTGSVHKSSTRDYNGTYHIQPGLELQLRILRRTTS